MDGAQQHVSDQYLYTLMNGYNDGWGLFTAGSSGDDTQPTQMATDIHNLTQILQDTASTAMSFIAGTANVSLTGLPSSGNDMLLEKSNGAFDLVIRNEPGINTPLSKAVSVGINLGGAFQNVAVYDPTSGTSPVSTLSSASSLTVGVNDHPMIIEFSGFLHS